MPDIPKFQGFFTTEQALPIEHLKDRSGDWWKIVIYLMSQASHPPRPARHAGKNIVLQKGQEITTLEQIMAATGCSNKVAYSTMKALEADGWLTRSKCRKTGTLFTLLPPLAAIEDGKREEVRMEVQNPEKGSTKSAREPAKQGASETTDATRGSTKSEKRKQDRKCYKRKERIGLAKRPPTEADFMAEAEKRGLPPEAGAEIFQELERRGWKGKGGPISQPLDYADGMFKEAEERHAASKHEEAEMDEMRRHSRARLAKAAEDERRVS